MGAAFETRQIGTHLFWQVLRERSSKRIGGASERHSIA
jgi:hypothetical protein